MKEIIEMDQWSSTADNIKDLKFDEIEIYYLKGGDSEAVKRIFGGHFIRRTVTDTAIPYIGNVWYIKDEDTGGLKKYRAKYDSSD
jgi:hypothetical protein